MHNTSFDRLFDSLQDNSIDEAVPIGALRLVCAAVGALPAFQPQIERDFRQFVMAARTANAARVSLASAARAFGASLDDASLLAEVLEGGEDGWRELVRRYDADLRCHVADEIALHDTACALPSDAIDDVMGDFYLSLCADDRLKLRTFTNGHRGVRLETWLRLLVADHAARHVDANSKALRASEACKDAQPIHLEVGTYEKEEDDGE